MEISVVIGSYNQCDKLKLVIDGFKAQEVTCRFELIIVDSLSTDGTQEMLDSLASESLPFTFPSISRNNSGKAEARNYGGYV